MELGPNEYRCCGRAAQINPDNYKALEDIVLLIFIFLIFLFSCPLCFFLADLWLCLLILCPAYSRFCLPLTALPPSNPWGPARHVCSMLCFQGVKLPELVSSYEWLVDRMSSYGRYDISLCVHERKRESVCVCEREKERERPCVIHSKCAKVCTIMA